MENLVRKKEQSPKLDAVIKILSVIAFISIILDIIWESYFEKTSYTNLIYNLFAILPVILFIIYFPRLYRKSQATILVPVIFGLVSIPYIMDIIISLTDGYSIPPTYFLIVFAFAVSTVCALYGLKLKFLVVVAILIHLYRDMWGIYRFVLYSHTISGLLYYWGLTIFFIALLLFVLTKKIPAVISSSSKSQAAGRKITNPEEELKLLKESFDHGTISEEVYKARRADILNKL